MREPLGTPRCVGASASSRCCAFQSSSACSAARRSMRAEVIASRDAVEPGREPVLERCRAARRPTRRASARCRADRWRAQNAMRARHCSRSRVHGRQRMPSERTPSSIAGIAAGSAAGAAVPPQHQRPRRRSRRASHGLAARVPLDQRGLLDAVPRNAPRAAAGRAAPRAGCAPRARPRRALRRRCTPMRASAAGPGSTAPRPPLNA